MPAAEFIILVGLVGLAVGSFLNVCIDRLPRKLSIVTLPSHCEQCQHPLAPWDLVPVLSYLWLRGKCRYCKASIPLRIAVVEMTTGLLFAYVAFRYEATIETVVVLIVVFFIDLEHSLILNRIIYPSIVAGLLLGPLGGPLGDGQSALQAYLYARWVLLWEQGCFTRFTWPPGAGLVVGMSCWADSWGQCWACRRSSLRCRCHLSLAAWLASFSSSSRCGVAKITCPLGPSLPVPR